jgi:4-hydroxybenzoate polyprenyltransferase
MLAYVKLLRLPQWTKNGFCLAGLFFSGKFVDPEAVQAALLTFGVYCMASSSVYIFNDLLDRERDRKHPKKCHRPIASGAVRIPAAALLGVILAGTGLAGASVLGGSVLGCLMLYLVNNVMYSLRLKHIPLFDVLCIAFGFMLRLLAGVYAVGELPTTWITLCTFFLALFLGGAKRQAELAGLIEEEDKMRRPVLSKYTVQFLDYLVNSSAIMAMMCYALFTTTSGKNPSLVVTVPIVFFAIMHYKRLVMVLNFGDEPDRILLKDLPIQVSIMLWLVSYFVVMYSGIRLFQ